MRLWTALALALPLAAGLPPPTVPPAHAQTLAPGLTADDNGKPIEIEADDGIEWQQNNRVYIARGNARATRGQATVFADTLIAYYRPICSPEAQAAAKRRAAAQAASAAASAKGGGQHAAKSAATQTHTCPPAGAAPAANAAAKSQQSSGGIGNSGATEIYRIEADGHVRIATETQTIYGDHAVEDLDKSLLVVTGKHLKLETPRDTVTARDSLEWYDDKQLAVARGDAVEVRDDKRLAADVLTAEVEKDAKGASHISRIDAHGNVLVSSADQIARGDAGVYNVDTGIATLTGRVTLTRGQNELRGQYAVVDLNNNVSRLLSAPPSAKLTAGSPAHTRVAGLLVPRPKPTPPPQAEPAKPVKAQ